MAITSKTVRLEAELRNAIAGITDAQTRDMVRAWATAWDEITPDLTDALLSQLTAGADISRAQLARSKRLADALDIVAGKLDDLLADAGVTITDTLQDVIDTTGGAQASIIDSQLPPRSKKLVDLKAWSRVDERQLTAIVKRSTQQITSRLRPLSVSGTAAVRRELIRGVVVGSNPRETATRILARTEGRFNGGLARALTIARTETLDAHREAARIGQAQHKAVLQGWEWLATLGSRTCPACWGMNGTFHALDEPGPSGHQNCRCARIPVTKPWSELGFKGLTEPPSALPTSEDAFAGLSKREQVDVLGPKGWAAWNAGEFPQSKWAVRRETEGWRDSYVPAKPPKVTGAGAGGGRRSDIVKPDPDPEDYPEVIGGGDPVPFRPADRPRINRDAAFQEHVFERHARGGTDGTQFPTTWSDAKIIEVADQILARPASVGRRDHFLNFYGTVDEVRIIVRLLEKKRTFSSVTPVEGPGVIRKGKHLPHGTTRHRGVRW